MIEIFWLDQIQLEQRPQVGHKAFYLSQMLQKGYPVVPGFVISAPTLQAFLETIEWSNSLFADLPYSSLRLDLSNYRQLQAIAQQIRQIIQAAPVPEVWVAALQQAVAGFATPTIILRPSLALQTKNRGSGVDVIQGHSSAILRTRICSIDSDAIGDTLKQIWADLFAAKSLFYWQRSGIPLTQVRLAVLVQPLQPAIAAGTISTDAATIEVRSVWGLGLGLSHGDMIPDRHQMERNTGALKAESLGRKIASYHVKTTRTTGSHSDRVLIDADGWVELALSNDIEQAKYALTPAQLSHLTQLSQHLTRDLGANLELEWVLAELADATTPIWLTQVMPVPPRVIHPLPVAAKDQAHIQPDQVLVTGWGASGGEVIATATVVTDPHTLDTSFVPGTALVISTLPTHYLPLLKQTAAVVIEQGSMTSHTAIIAREMNIPAVVGATGATQRIQPGEVIRVDGQRGLIYRAAADVQPSHISLPIAPVAPTLAQPKGDRPPIRTQLMVNLSQPESLQSVANLPIDGVGLLRSELLIVPMLNQQHPAQWLQQGLREELIQRIATTVCQFTTALAPRPVFYRSLDLRSHEFRGLAGGDRHPVEPNPILGVRGTFSYIVNPALFELELAALKQVQLSGAKNIRLILPFVRSVAEFRFCHQRVEQMQLFEQPQFQLWIMAEVPSVLFLLPEYADAGVQGIAIGSNDLTQLLLAVDRDYEPISTAYDERHPAVKAAIAHLIQQAMALGLPCSICGQAPVLYPELIQDLVAWGITSISVEPNAVETTYAAIAQAEQSLHQV